MTEKRKEKREEASGLLRGWLSANSLHFGGGASVGEGTVGLEGGGRESTVVRCSKCWVVQSPAPARRCGVDTEWIFPVRVRVGVPESDLLQTRVLLYCSARACVIWVSCIMSWIMWICRTTGSRLSALAHMGTTLHDESSTLVSYDTEQSKQSTPYTGILICQW